MKARGTIRLRQTRAGVSKFSAAFDVLLGSIEKKLHTLPTERALRA